MTLDDLDRPTLVRVAYEYMLFGMLATRAMLPNAILIGGDMDLLNGIAIWKLRVWNPSGEPIMQRDAVEKLRALRVAGRPRRP